MSSKLGRGGLAVGLVAFGATVLTLDAAATTADKTYEVTITNLTEGQPFSPPVIAMHKGGLKLFRVGKKASEAVQEIAENGNNGPMLDLLEGSNKVVDFTSGSEPLVPEADPGETGFGHQASFTVTSSSGGKRLSIVFMLVCTNDGFSGVSRLKLPKEVGESITLYTVAYDAGTEINTEDFADLVPPCQELIGIVGKDEGTGMSNPKLAENGKVQPHSGIQGGADLLLDVHAWADPVAQVVVTRVD